MIQRYAERATGLTWQRLHDLLEPIKAVRYQAEGHPIVQTSKPSPEATALLKKLGISTPKPLLHVG